MLVSVVDLPVVSVLRLTNNVTAIPKIPIAAITINEMLVFGLFFAHLVNALFLMMNLYHLPRTPLNNIFGSGVSRQPHLYNCFASDALTIFASFKA